MKKLALLFTVISLTTLKAQSDKTLSYGVQWGLHGNHSDFAGGMEEANARFIANPYGGAAFDLIARYDLNDRWMASSGLGFSTYGFDFALTENYQLVANNVHSNGHSIIRTKYTMVNLPFMIHYKFSPDCKNRRWVLGVGVVASLTERRDDASSFQKGTEGNTNFKYLTSTTSANGNNTLTLRLSAAKEKTLKCGGLLQIGFLANIGFTTLAHATVIYTVDGKEHNHEFVNRGNFAGIRFAYFFKSGRQSFGQ